MTGNIIAQALPIVITPVLTRIYTPEDFGILALFIAITAILSSVVNGRYELAIGLPEADDDAVNIAALAVLISAGVSFLILIIVATLGREISVWVGNEKIYIWLYLAPLSVLLIGIYNVLNYLNNRLKNFKDIAVSQVYKSITLVVFQLILALIKNGAMGLIVGHISSQLASNGRLYKGIGKIFSFEKISIAKIKKLAKRYKSFPLYSMWSGVFNKISHNIAVFYIPVFFGITTLGMYHLVSKVLGAPSVIISNAIGQVFLQKATEERKRFGHARNSFNKTVKKLFFIGFPLFTIIFFVSEDLFSIIFGDKWRGAGIYAAALTPLFFIRFIVSTVSMMNVVFEKNQVGFYWQIGLLLLNVSILTISFYFKLSFITYLYITSAALSIHYLALLVIMSSYNKVEKKYETIT